MGDAVVVRRVRVQRNMGKTRVETASEAHGRSVSTEPPSAATV